MNLFYLITFHTIVILNLFIVYFEQNIKKSQLLCLIFKLFLRMDFNNLI